jgi:outer membrane protein
MRMRDFFRILMPGLLLGACLAGCASASLVLAPEAPDAPFKPASASVPDGEVRPSSLPPTTRSGARDFGLPPMEGLPLVPPPPAIDPTHTYSLAELIDLAQSNNPETRVAWEHARQAALAVGIAKALYLPVLTATAVSGAQHESGSTQAALGSLAVNNNLNGNLNGTVGSVALEWLIFDFGQRDALTRATTDLSFASNVAFNGTHQKIIYDVSRAFYDYSSARQRVAIAAQSKTESAHLLDAAQNRLKQGIGTTVETAQAQQFLAQAAFNLVEARGAERDSYHSLLAAVGISPVATLRIEDVSGRLLPANSMVPVEHIIAEALARRPDIQASYAAARATRAAVTAVEADFLPKVFVAASNTYATGSLDLTSLPSVPSLGSISTSLPSLPAPTPTTSSIPNLSSTLGNISLNRNDTTVLAGVAVPLFDGGVRDARVHEARSRTEAAESTVLRLEQNAAMEIVAADDALRSSLEANRAATVLVSASLTAYDAALAAYKSGEGTLTTALETERALLSARIAKARAHGTAQIAAASLAFSTGRLSSSDVVDPQPTRRQKL